MSQSNVIWFADLALADAPVVGGKNASLGELTHLKGLKVPDGFAITTHAFRRFIEPLSDKIARHLAEVTADGCNDLALLQRSSQEIRALIEAQPLDRDLEAEIVGD